MAEEKSRKNLKIAVSDVSEFRALRAWLDRVPGIEVSVQADSPVPGRLGAWDTMTLLAGSGGTLAVALRALPEFIRSRRSNVSVTVTARGRKVTLDARNVDEVIPLIEKILDE
jgi:hypothetical protein